MKVMVDSECLDKLKPIKKYELVSGEKLIILDERFSVADDEFVGFGYIDDYGDTFRPTLFKYTLNDNKVTEFYGVSNGTIIELVGGELVIHNIAIQQ